MISPQEALAKILGNTAVLMEETVSLLSAVGRVSAQNILAREDGPAFDNSAMDGFAVRAGDLESASEQEPVALRLKQVIGAGASFLETIEPGEAARIMTGAALPPGADAVVMQELARSENGQVTILRRPKPGEHIRRHGEDVRAGDVILEKGARVRPYEVSLLASQGILDISVVRKPRVGIVSTGSELVDPRETPGPGRIRNSNALALAAGLSRWGIISAVNGPVGDDPALLRAAFREAMENSDVLLLSGGVSVGEFDYTQTILKELGVEIVFWKTAIKPGKPLLFGVKGNKIVFGLPGNPVAVLLCLEEFVRPALEKMQGYEPGHPSYHLKGILENDYPKDEHRQQYLFCRVKESDDGFQVHVIRPQGSAMMGMAARANALAVGPLGVKALKKGMSVAFRWLK